MRLLAIAVSLLLVLTEVASAQNRVTQPPSRPALHAVMQGGRIVWGPWWTGQTDPVITQVVRIYLDERAFRLTGWTCLPLDPEPGDTNPVTCQWAISPELRTAMDTPGPHVLVMTSSETVTDTTGTHVIESGPSNLIEWVTPSLCPYLLPGATTPEQRMIGSTLQGSIPRNRIAGDNYAAGRLAQLRKDGWRVEWQLDGGAGPLFVAATCVGVPQ